VTVDPSDAVLEGDSTQLEIVLYNLTANAIDSLAHHPTSRRQIEICAGMNQSGLLLSVEDSGPGVPTDLAPKLFEPFVTSKPDGMGLGLAISRSLIRARGGDLSYSCSTRLGGAAFTVQLPFEVPTEAAFV
jgi:C4-dicarboxylate-specific signal transduction histidine kinase